ncbi:hypothetical protein [Brevibacterium spongiae]|uniref:Uncharacterized protein n=1 Tax=Brevibacterium spongiae TaxID=2909672 RepID=A0ABY5SQ00_9MICO|nr:hypothetical protein [Brevibacterium spongiae]UVI36562.1 hypothetical protein L1F31_02525 [Brevibacterium spongiae]
MKFLKRALVASFAALSLAIAPAVSAEAASAKFDVTKSSAKSIVVSSSADRQIEIEMLHKKSGVKRWKVVSDIYKAEGYSNAGEEADVAIFANDDDPRRTRVALNVSRHGLGKYEIGASRVSGYDSTDWDAEQVVSRTDFTKGSFYVRGKTDASLSSNRKGGTVTLTSSTKVYNPERYSKVAYSPKVKFQVKSGGKWKTLKMISAKRGKAVYKVKSKSKKYYRVTFSQKGWATGATSKSVRR